jgi:hypothetical protein
MVLWVIILSLDAKAQPLFVYCDALLGLQLCFIESFESSDATRCGYLLAIFCNGSNVGYDLHRQGYFLGATSGA